MKVRGEYLRVCVRISEYEKWREFVKEEQDETYGV